MRFTQGEIEMNIGKLSTQKNSNFFFGWRGPLVGGGYMKSGMQGGVCKMGYARCGIRGKVWVKRTFGRWGGVCEVRYVKWGLCEMRFTQGGTREVKYMQGEIYTSHLVKFFTPWYYGFLIYTMEGHGMQSMQKVLLTKSVNILNWKNIRSGSSGLNVDRTEVLNWWKNGVVPAEKNHHWHFTNTSEFSTWTNLQDIS